VALWGSDRFKGRTWAGYVGGRTAQVEVQAGGSAKTLARIWETYLDPMLMLAMGLLNDQEPAENVAH
jgi:hypothetical protein